MASRPADVEQTLDLPPGYTLVALREFGDAFVHGCAIASDTGAGTLVWVRRYDLVEFAVVLEPEEPLLSARRAFFAGMNAAADAIAAHCPPEREVSFDWPDAIRFDGGLLGGARLGWPADCAEDEVPAWLVFGVMLRAADMAHVEQVQTATGVSLLSEGFEMVDTDAIIGSFARHLMTAFDLWNERGFETIARDYLARLPSRKAGERRRIDLSGDLLITAPTGSGPPGAFVFWNQDPANLGQKQRVALRSGFLGIDSLGWSTLAIVTEATEADRQAMVERLASQLQKKFGAPDLNAARLAAEEEVAFAASLCDHPPQTLLAVQRSVENGEIRERFRTLKPREAAAGADRLHAHAPAFTFHEVEGDVEPTEEVDLPGMIRNDRRTDRT